MYNNDNYKLQNRLINEISEEMNIDRKIVYKVIRSQWGLLKQIIENQNPDNIFCSLKIKQLGIFGVKNNRFKISKTYNYLYVPKDKIVKHIDPRKQNTN